MIIKESVIRKIIMNAILSEVTGPRMGQIETAAELECPYYRDMPEKFATLLKSGTFGEMSNTLSKKFPKIASDLGLLGLGSGAGEISRNQNHPSDIAAIADSNNSAQILFGYISSYLYATGMGCLEYYYLGVALDFLNTLFGGSNNNSQSMVNSAENNVIVEFRKGIEEKALNLANKASNTAGFINKYPFYSFPSLAAKGPQYNENDSVDLLKKDLKQYQLKIGKIRQVSSTSILGAYLE